MRERPLYRRHSIWKLKNGMIYYAIYDRLPDGGLMRNEFYMPSIVRSLIPFRMIRKNAVKFLNEKKKMFKLSGV